ncbi:MAG: hypothetical protein K2X45_20865 [Phreatobacter sp.]|nr:hypothetical protein [Phreatobacter sp.]
MQFTKGDSFEFSGPVTLLQNGVALTDMTGWEAASQIRLEDGTLVAELEVTWLDRTPPVINLECPATETQSWPTGPARFDIQFTSPTGKVVSTRAARFTITQDVTRQGA